MKKKNKSRRLGLIVFIALLTALVFGLSSRYLKISVSSNESEYPSNYLFVTENEDTGSYAKKILFFSSAWCGPCGTIRNKLVDAAFQNEKVNIFEISLESGNSLTGNFDVKSVPTVILESNGRTYNVEGFDISALDKLVSQSMLE